MCKSVSTGNVKACSLKSFKEGPGERSHWWMTEVAVVSYRASWSITQSLVGRLHYSRVGRDLCEVVNWTQPPSLKY